VTVDLMGRVLQLVLLLAWRDLPIDGGELAGREERQLPLDGHRVTVPLDVDRDPRGVHLAERRPDDGALQPHRPYLLRP